jgi:hypothetical protein
MISLISGEEAVGKWVGRQPETKATTDYADIYRKIYELKKNKSGRVAS